MTQSLFIGVDGGATKCLVRVEDEQGNLLGRAVSGSANIRLSVEKTWQAIEVALREILQPLVIDLFHTKFALHAGMGLAGCEVSAAYQAFLQYPHPFTTLIVSSDAHTACLGAHSGADGAIIIAGTGVVGFQIQDQQTMQVSGWGFPHDDIGGGAWLGLEAVKITLQALDGRGVTSALSAAILQRFADKQDELVEWANRANSSMFAELAPLVIQAGESGDKSALALLQQAARELDRVGAALQRRQTNTALLPCALSGGVAPHLARYLSPDLQNRLSECQETPDVGAILLAKHNLSL